MSKSRIVTVTIEHDPRPDDAPPNERWQGWSFIVKAANGEPIARSTERYANLGDCKAAAALLFEPRNSVRLIEPGAGVRFLRIIKPDNITCSRCGRKGKQQFNILDSGNYVCRATDRCAMQAQKRARQKAAR